MKRQRIDDENIEEIDELFGQERREIEKVNRETEELRRQTEEATKEVARLKSLVNTQMDDKFMFFTPAMPSSANSSKHRRVLAQMDQPYWKVCLFCGSDDNITRARLVADSKDMNYSAFGKPYYKTDLDLKSIRNFIPLCGTLGQKGTCRDLFDKYLISMLYNPLSKKYRIICLDSTADQYRLHGNEVELKHEPYTRLLAWRTKFCVYSSYLKVDPDDITYIWRMACFSEISRSIVVRGREDDTSYTEEEISNYHTEEEELEPSS